MTGFFPPLNLPEGIVLLITDELAAPAEFVLHRTLANHLKKPIQRGKGRDGQSQAKAVILSVSEGVGRWKALALKYNINLQSHIDSGSLIFIDVVAEIQPPTGREKENSLRKIYDRLGSYLFPMDTSVSGSQPKLAILDDISTLEWIGFPLPDVLRFIRALRALCIKTNTTLLIRHHLLSPTEAEPDDLFRILLQISTYHMEVKPLSSGRSGDVSGEICLHHGYSKISDDAKLIPRSSALQYRLGDSGPEFFAKGTSGGVL